MNTSDLLNVVALQIFEWLDYFYSAAFTLYSGEAGPIIKRNSKTNKKSLILPFQCSL